MPRPKNTTPVYKLHSSTGLARCWVNGKWTTLGKYGSAESKAEFARIVAELATGSPAAEIGQQKQREEITVDGLLVAWWKYANQHYRRPDGSPTNQITEYFHTLKPVHELYGHTLAKDFGPLALKAVRVKMVEAKWCRSQINSRIGKVKRVFKWAVAEQLVPVAVYTALATLTGLQKGRTEAARRNPSDQSMANTSPPPCPISIATFADWCGFSNSQAVGRGRPCSFVGAIST